MENHVESSRDLLLKDVIWTLLLFNLLLPYVGCAPRPLSTTFFDAVYQNSSNHTCLALPRVSENDENYIKVKLNLACSPVTVKEGAGIFTPNTVCNSLADLFVQFCKLPNNVTSRANLSVDLSKASSRWIELKTFCTDVVSVYKNISNSNSKNRESGSWTIPFHAETDELETCKSVCVNIPTKDFLPMESKFIAAPECIFLLEGYRMYQQVSIMVQNSSRKLLGNPLSVTKSISSDHSNNDNDSGKSLKVQSQALKQVALESVITTSSMPPPSEVPGLDPTGHNREGVGAGIVESAIDRQKSDHVTEASPVSLQKHPNKNSSSKSQQSSSSGSTSSTQANPISLGVNSEKSESLPTPNDASVNEKLENEESNTKTSKKLQEQKQLSGSSSSTTSTTTSASVDIIRDDVPAPPEASKSKDAKSSTAVPAENKGSVPSNNDALVDKPKASDNQELSKVSESGKASKTKEDKIQPPNNPSSSTKKTMMYEDLGNIPPVPEDDYTSGEEMDDAKPPTKLDADQGLDSPLAVGGSKNVGYETESNFGKGQKSESNFIAKEFSNGMPFESQGTTINVALNESTDTGFFNYFLFCATLAGLLYLVVHNKKKLIAYVVEGRRPRNRSRRSSTSSQYRRLENNFD